MAGTNANFNADEFRSAIQTAMQMGQANDTSQQATFVWPEVDTYSPEGPDNDPYSWTQTPVTTTAGRTVIQLNCAVEYSIGPVSGSEIGEFDASHAVITILDVDYTLVEGATQVILGGSTYDIDAPGWVPTGLFNVTVYQAHCSAVA